MTLTVEDEIAAMRQRWPQFRVTAACDAIVTWRGTLAPLRQVFEVRILYGPNLFLGRTRLLNRHPRVEVISPRLVDEHPVTGKPVAHVYFNNVHPDSPLLCVYDPATNEWQPGKVAVADTIVPWTASWLACYEGWLATGKWSGGGRHPTSRIPETDSRDQLSGANRTSSVRNHQLKRAVAEFTGTHGSRAVLAYATTEPRDIFDTAESHFIYQSLLRSRLIGPRMQEKSDPESAKLVLAAA